ncbi:pseudouridine synthase [Lysobacter sp. A3-1-A15]|uniref:pseudouridine synthase n=1 Tax=Novilysobacter viscosus TaxID=3098602 RepID=UPI002ED80287
MKRPPVRHGLARVLSKRGVCSRSQAAQWVQAGRVRVDGRVVRDPEYPVVEGRHVVEVDDGRLAPPVRHYIALNKPRGLVTTASDERGRGTVYQCLEGSGLPWMAPVGRLDKASEGLLLMCNDPAWAAVITSPATGPDKTYHVQVDRVPHESLLDAVRAGAAALDGEHLHAKSVRLLRAGTRNAWLEVVLDEGRNRQIRRLLSAFDLSVSRLVRVRIGAVALGDLAKGAWRELSPEEVASLAPETMS